MGTSVDTSHFADLRVSKSIFVNTLPGEGIKMGSFIAAESDEILHSQKQTVDGIRKLNEFGVSKKWFAHTLTCETSRLHDVRL